MHRAGLLRYFTVNLEVTEYYRVERGLQGLPSSRGVEHMARGGSVDGFENCEKEVKM